MDGASRSVTLDGELSLDTAFEIADGMHHPVLGPTAAARTAGAAARMARIVDERRHVYGITTGFGPLADRLIDPDQAEILQQNLVYHLASGVGAPLPWREARAMVLARLNSILQGVSGASAETIQMLVSLLQSPIAPYVPEKGTVGASGDLTPLAHMVLAFQGKGRFLTSTGAILDGAQGLKELGLPPLRLSNRDGLALVNGTSAMTGIALCNSRAAARAIDWSLALSAALGEVLSARVEAWHPVFSNVRPHPGQRRACEALGARVAGSARLTTTLLADGRIDAAFGAPIGQDAYTLRCVPQVIGAVIDSAASHDQTVTIELNSVTDNPVFPDAAEIHALHGGNFMGQQIGLVSDALGTAITVLAGLAERQIARLTDERLNGGLPAFLSRAEAGLSSGLMGAQVTATALVAEMRTLTPASQQSISTNGANQDVVSMGTIAARQTRARLEMCHQVLAILALSIAQAMDILEADGGFSPQARAVLRVVREIAPEMPDDRPLGKEISALASEIARRPPPQV